MAGLTFTISDFQTPERTERLFRRLNQTLSQLAEVKPPELDLAALSLALAPLIRSELQAPGVAPLNLQSLLPSTGLGIMLEDTHANRLALYPVSSTDVGTLFWETDRTVLYAVTETLGVKAWTYIAGLYSAAFASRPTDLGASDIGFQLWVSVYNHRMKWGGSAWAFIDTPGGYTADFLVTPPGSSGWVLCDGAATTYLAISGADLAETALTTPDEITAPSGVYHKSIAAYTGTINAATAGALSGSTANTTATNQAAATGVTIADHPDHIHDDASSIAVPDLFFVDVLGTGVAARTGVQLTTGGAALTLSHPVTDPTHNHTQDAHLHAAGTLAVAATGEPRNLGVMRYLRR